MSVVAFDDVPRSSGLQCSYLEAVIPHCTAISSRRSYFLQIQDVLLGFTHYSYHIIVGTSRSLVKILHGSGGHSKGERKVPNDIGCTYRRLPEIQRSSELAAASPQKWEIQFKTACQAHIKCNPGRANQRYWQIPLRRQLDGTAPRRSASGSYGNHPVSYLS